MSTYVSRPRPEGGDTSGWTYAVPGVVSWLVIASCALGAFLVPQLWTAAATVFVVYLTGYVAFKFVFSLVGEYQRRRWVARDWTVDEDVPGPFGFAPADVRHAVIVPNYKEPLDVLERTLAGLSAQYRAEERVVVVLAMEEREPGSREKGEALAARWEGSFLRMIVSVHPADLPGELACKGSNQTWASREARRVMVEEMGIPLELITLTTGDADSVIHPKYLSALARLFAYDEKRHARFWQAPMLFYNNIWRVVSPIRYSAWLMHAAQVSELAMPFYDSLPISTYSWSMRLAEETGWWDTAVITEDWHSYLGVMFARDGDVSVTSVFLPTSGDAVDGPTPWQALVNRYLQLLRHFWGAEEFGYVLRSMIAERRVPRLGTVVRAGQILHDHVLAVAGWFVLVSAGFHDVLLARPAFASAYVSAETVLEPLHLLLSVMLLVGLSTAAVSVLVEVVRNPPPQAWHFARVVAECLAMWVFAPVTGFFLCAAPAVHAQTKLMLGMPLAWRVTPKNLVERMGEAG